MTTYLDHSRDDTSLGFRSLHGVCLPGGSDAVCEDSDGLMGQETKMHQNCGKRK